MKIKAAVVYEHDAPFVIKEVDLAAPKDTEILVKMAGCGICHADLLVKEEGPTPLPAVFGHEGSGVVEEVGRAVTHLRPGDHVVFCSYSCGACEACLNGHPAWCIEAERVNFGGAYADDTKRLSDGNGVELSCFFGQSSFSTYVVANRRSAVKVDKGVDVAMLGPLGCAFQTGAGSILNVLRPESGESIAIFGCGSVGLAALMAAKASGCRAIIGVDTVPFKLEAATELGATHVINANDEPDILAKLLEITDGRGLDLTYDTIGSDAIITAAIESLRKGGACGTVARADDRTVGLKLGSLIGNSRSLVGIVQGDSVPWNFIPKLIELYKGGLFPFDKLIKYYDFEDINKAADDARAGLVIKPVLRF